MKKKNLFKTNLLGGILVFLLVAFMVPVRATNYYVDATNGNDSNEGTSPATAWKTPGKVSSFYFSPRDSVLFKRGDVFRGNITPRTSGTAEAPITFGAYGEGKKPLFLGSINYTQESLWTSIGNNLWTTANESFPSDVGFILFDEESIDNTGYKRKTMEDVSTDKDFWYDRENKRVIIYCTQNPSLAYSSIEIGYNAHVHDHLIQGLYTGCSYIHIENLEIKYFNSCAICFTDAVGIEVRDCDMSWGGGAARYYFENGEWLMSRHGNGVTWWNDAKDCIVERCRIGQCFDSGVSPQAGSNMCEVSNIIFRDNVIWASDMANFEIGFGNEDAIIEGIYFENNICIGAGRGWSREQRTHKILGWDITTWYGYAKVFDGLHINNNVLYNAWGYSMLNMWNTEKCEITNFTMDYNYYYKPEASIWDQVSYMFQLFDPSDPRGYVIYKTKKTDQSKSFNDYQNATGREKNSVFDFNRNVAQKAARKILPDQVRFANKLFQEDNELMTPGNAPSDFALISPADGASINGEVTFSWRASTGSTSPVDHYEIWVDNKHHADVPAENNSYQTILTNKTHSWFVVAVCENDLHWRQSTDCRTVTTTGGIPLYTLEVESGSGSGSYVEGDTISITPDKLTGKTFKAWSGDTEYLISSVVTAKNYVVMPAKEITLTAVYEDILYILTVENGTGSGTEYKYGQVVEITANEAANGLVFTKWIGDTNYITRLTIPVTTVTMPDGNVTVTATYKEDKPLFNWNIEAADVVLDEGSAKENLTNNGSITTGGTEPNPPGYGSVGAIFNGTDQYLSLKNSDYGNRALNGTDREGTIYVALKPSSISNHSFFWSLYSVTAGRQVALTLDHGKPAFYFGIQEGAHDNVDLPHTFSAGDEIILALSLDAEAKNYTFMAKDMSSNEYHTVTQSDKELSGIYNNGIVDLVIGGRSDLSSSWFFDGTIYWVRVYDELHSEEKMKKIIENSSRAEKSTEIDKSVTSNSFSVYPNPVQSEFTIYSTNGFEGNAKVEIYNQTGKRIYRSTGKVSFPHKVDVSSFNAGIYLVKVTDGNDQKTVKIMKQ